MRSHANVEGPHYFREPLVGDRAGQDHIPASLEPAAVRGGEHHGADEGHRASGIGARDFLYERDIDAVGVDRAGVAEDRTAPRGGLGRQRALPVEHAGVMRGIHAVGHEMELLREGALLFEQRGRTDDHLIRPPAELGVLGHDALAHGGRLRQLAPVVGDIVDDRAIAQASGQVHGAVIVEPEQRMVQSQPARRALHVPALHPLVELSRPAPSVGQQLQRTGAHHPPVGRGRLPGLRQVVEPAGAQGMGDIERRLHEEDFPARMPRRELGADELVATPDFVPVLQRNKDQVIHTLCSSLIR